MGEPQTFLVLMPKRSDVGVLGVPLLGNHDMHIANDSKKGNVQNLSQKNLQTVLSSTYFDY